MLTLTGQFAAMALNPYPLANSITAIPFRGPNDTICLGDTTSLSASNPLALSYAWTPAYNISSTTVPNPLVFPAITTTYYVIINSITGNLITNGDFSQGNTGFTSAYTYTTNLVPEGTYCVGTNPATFHVGFANCGDHTTGNGNMMVVNGTGTPNTNVWQQNVTVVPNSTYVFSCWLASVVASSPARLQFFVNNVQIGPIFQAGNINCNWNMFYDTWNSGAATTANIVIKNQNTVLSGNDFAIDDLYFARIVEIHDSTLIIVEDPVISLGNDTAICSGDTVYLTPGSGYAQYQWSNGMTSATIPVYSPGNYWVRVSTQHGCIASDTIAISILQLPAMTALNDSVCTGDTAQLSIVTGPGFTYLWSNGAVTPSISVVPLSTTTYSVTIFDSMGCSDSASAIAFIKPLPSIHISNDTTICRGTMATLTASGGQSYLWSPTGEIAPSIVVAPFASSTMYTVQVTDTNHCSDSASVEVSTVPLPEITFWQEADTLCIGRSALITAGGGTAYSWNTGDLTASISISPQTNTVYSVTVSNSYGSISCSNDTSVLQAVRNCLVLYIPNAMSLSGVNNSFKPIGEFYGSEGYHLSIFDRWGKLIFETDDFDEAWEGTYRGKYVAEGVYVYQVVAGNGLSEPFITQGTVTVLR